MPDCESSPIYTIYFRVFSAKCLCLFKIPKMHKILRFTIPIFPSYILINKKVPHPEGCGKNQQLI